MKQINNFSRVLNMEVWGKLQDSISEAIGMAILTIDYRGTPVTSHSGCREFCRRVRNDDKLGIYCRRCDARGSLEGVMAQKPYIYRCHFSVVDIAIPIIADENYLGAIMVGQVQLQTREDGPNPEQILFVDDSELQSKREELREYYEQIPFCTTEQLDNIVAMLYHLCDFFVKEALNKEPPKDLGKRVPLENKRPDMPNVSNRIISSAIDYIYSAKDQAVSLTEVARHCHVSAPYLSRLFTKEMGATYSTFVAQLKIMWAKEILQNTADGNGDQR